jgi:hypothetical protein
MPREETPSMRRSLVSFSSALAAFAALATCAYASVASAQTAVVAAAPPAAPPPAGDNVNDHDTVVGHFAVGYFGISNLPVGGAPTGGGTPTAGAGVTEQQIQAPVIGARYWLTPKLGIDAGVGFSDSSAGWGVGIHGGVPLALATSKHLTFELIPEVTVGFAGNSTGSGNTSVTYSGFLFDIGARIGGEIQFGFIGIPQLALQGTVGLYLQHESYSYSTTGNSGSGSSTTFTTSVGSDPWGIFTDNISALYYF